MNLTDKQQRLFAFVKEKHGDQKRKYTGEPYYTHLLGVAEIVGRFVNGLTEIALCHDLLEDTTCATEELYSAMSSAGYKVSEQMIIMDGVVSLTNVYTKQAYPEMNRAKRKRLEACRLGAISVNAQNVKLADLIHNTQSIAKHDPDFAKVYLQEKVSILDKMRKGNINLFIECCHTLRQAQLSMQKHIKPPKQGRVISECV